MYSILTKNIAIVAFLSLSLFANVSVSSVKYEGGISLYGKVGSADIRLEEDSKNNTYKMVVVASSSGIIKKLTDNREDIFTSEGKIKNGIYIPDTFTVRVQKDSSTEITTYAFDAKNKQVLKTKYKKEMQSYSRFDVIKVAMVKYSEPVESTSSEYIDYESNDFLSLFLNVRNGNMEHRALTYIDKKETDKIELVNSTLFEVSKENGKEKYAINIVNDGTPFMKEAIAKDIAFYGDAYIKKVYENVMNS